MNKRKSKKTTDSKKSDKSKGLNIELQETKDKYLRLYSEFENYRRRTSSMAWTSPDFSRVNLLRHHAMSLSTTRQEEISRVFARGIGSYSSRSRANRGTTIKLTRRNPLRFFYSIYRLI